MLMRMGHPGGAAKMHAKIGARELLGSRRFLLGEIKLVLCAFAMYSCLVEETSWSYTPFDLIKTIKLNVKLRSRSGSIR
jgi:hypothetical protein